MLPKLCSSLTFQRAPGPQGVKKNKKKMLGAEGSWTALPQLCAPGRALHLAGQGEMRIARNVCRWEGGTGRLGFTRGKAMGQSKSACRAAKGMLEH